MAFDSHMQVTSILSASGFTSPNISQTPQLEVSKFQCQLGKTGIPISLHFTKLTAPSQDTAVRVTRSMDCPYLDPTVPKIMLRLQITINDEDAVMNLVSYITPSCPPHPHKHAETNVRVMIPDLMKHPSAVSACRKPTEIQLEWSHTQTIRAARPPHAPVNEPRSTPT
jgi:hypothetical protein